MGIKYICGNCGYILYEFKKSSLGLLPPATIVELHKGKCPNCGKQLKYDLLQEWRERIIIRKR